ncbi:hypothetical protein P9112_004240 [Eukaryota sp. TZLM1-RC]
MLRFLSKAAETVNHLSSTASLINSTPSARTELLRLLDPASCVVFVHGFQCNDAIDNTQSPPVTVSKENGIPPIHSTFHSLPWLLQSQGRSVYIIDYSCKQRSFTNIVDLIYSHIKHHSLLSSHYVSHSCGGLVLGELSKRADFTPKLLIAIDTPFFGLNNTLNTILFNSELLQSLEDSSHIALLLAKLVPFFKHLYGEFLGVLSDLNYVNTIRNAFDSISSRIQGSLSIRVAPLSCSLCQHHCLCSFFNKYSEECQIWNFKRSENCVSSFGSRIKHHMSLFELVFSDENNSKTLSELVQTTFKDSLFDKCVDTALVYVEEVLSMNK